MNRSLSSKIKPLWTQTLGALLLAGCASSAAADYQQTLAAKGADAFAPPAALVTIEQEDIQRVFSMDAEFGNQAVSDKDIMVDLHARISGESQLKEAAQNLAPEADNVKVSRNEDAEAAAAEQSAKKASEPAGSIAAR